MSTPDSRKAHARRVAYQVNRNLSSAIETLAEAARSTMKPEFNQLTYELDRIQKRVNEITESVN